MHKLPSPVDDAAETYKTCISKVRKGKLKKRLNAAATIVAAAAQEFSNKAQAVLLHEIAVHTTVGKVAAKEMIAVYDGRMVGATSPGRPIYDRILAIPRLSRCPLCGVRDVATLDHFLPKARFPSLAVVPQNLVAACRDCNDEKDVLSPANPEQQFLHPYFDDVQGFRWLYAEVVVGSPASLRFYVNAAGAPSAVLGERIAYHFQKLKLAKLYASQAGDQVSEITKRLRDLHAAGGPEQVRLHLREERDTCAAVRVNAWRVASFDALAASDWYCDGGFDA